MKSKVGRRRRERDIDDYLDACGRMLRAAGRRIGEGEPEDLKVFDSLHLEIEHAMGEAVRGLRASGYTWQAIGDAKGFTKQAAIKRRAQSFADDLVPELYGAEAV